jgi:hypothetical protein
VLISAIDNELAETGGVYSPEDTMALSKDQEAALIKVII